MLAEGDYAAYGLAKPDSLSALCAAGDIGARYEYTYSVTDDLSMLPFHLLATRITYRVHFTRIAEGLDTFAEARGGVLMAGVWRIREGNSGTCYVLEETMVVECGLMMAGFIERSIKSSHEVMGRRFLEVLAERMMEREKSRGTTKVG